MKMGGTCKIRPLRLIALIMVGSALHPGAKIAAQPPTASAAIDSFLEGATKDLRRGHSRNQAVSNLVSQGVTVHGWG